MSKQTNINVESRVQIDKNGKKYIEYEGRKIVFKTAKDLQSKLRLPMTYINNLIKTRVQYNDNPIIKYDNDKLLKLNLKKDYLPLLLDKFPEAKGKEKEIQRAILGSRTRNQVNEVKLNDGASLLFLNKIGDMEKIKVYIIVSIYAAYSENTSIQTMSFNYEGFKDRIFEYVIPRIREQIGNSASFKRAILKIYDNQSPSKKEYVYSDEDIIMLTTDDLDAKISKKSKISKGENGILMYEITSLKSTSKGRKIDQAITIEIGNVSLYERYLQKKTPYVLTEFSNIVSVDTDGKCAELFLKNNYGKYSKSIDKLVTDKGVSLSNFMNFIETKQLDINIYDVIGNTIMQSKKKNSPSCILHDNHIYELKGDKPNKKRIKTDIKFVDDITKEFNTVISNGIIPARVKLNHQKGESMTQDDTLLKSFYIDGCTYINNPEYEICKYIYDHFNLDAKLPYDMTMTKLLCFIESHHPDYKDYAKAVTSFLPNKEYFNKSGFLYSQGEYEKDCDNLTTIDASRFFTNILSELDNLLVCDWRTAEIIDDKCDELRSDYLYLCEPDNRNLLMPDKNLFYYKILIKCRELKLPFTIINAIKCKVVPNYMKDLITTMMSIKDKQYTPRGYTKPVSIIKYAINIFIGTFTSVIKESHKYLFKGIVNKNQQSEYMTTAINPTIYNWKTEEVNKNGVISRRVQDGVKEKGSDYKICFETNASISGILSRKPIDVQIKDIARIKLYEKILTLNLKSSDDIIQIKTDSITYVGKPPSDMNGWKFEKYNPVEKTILENIYVDKKTLLVTETSDIPRELYMCYAGAGKTYYILNTLIPKLKDSYIVLTPTHTAAEPYRKLGINCNVIQYYSLRGILPKEQIIIIDEIGLMETTDNNFLCKLKLTNKHYYAFGDFKQLPNISHTDFSKPHYLKYIFNTIYNNTLSKNWRNGFSQQFYDAILNDEFSEKQIEQMIKKMNSCTTIKEAYIRITFANTPRNNMNAFMLKQLKKKKYDIGVKYLCKTNKYIDLGLYNNKECVIKNVKDNTITLDNDVEVTKKQIDNFFRLAYVKNLYNMQGGEASTIYYEDSLKYFNTAKVKHGNRILYTLISRLKGMNYNDEFFGYKPKQNTTIVNEEQVNCFNDEDIDINWGY